MKKKHRVYTCISVIIVVSAFFLAVCFHPLLYQHKMAHRCPFLTKHLKSINNLTDKSSRSTLNYYMSLDMNPGIVFSECQHKTIKATFPI